MTMQNTLKTEVGVRGKLFSKIDADRNPFMVKDNPAEIMPRTLDQFLNLRNKFSGKGVFDPTSDKRFADCYDYFYAKDLRKSTFANDVTSIEKGEKTGARLLFGSWLYTYMSVRGADASLIEIGDIVDGIRAQGLDILNPEKTNVSSYSKILEGLSDGVKKTRTLKYIAVGALQMIDMQSEMRNISNDERASMAKKIYFRCNELTGK